MVQRRRSALLEWALKDGELCQNIKVRAGEKEEDSGYIARRTGLVKTYTTSSTSNASFLLQTHKHVIL